MTNLKEKILNIFEKIKNNKKIQILLLGLVVSVILLVYIAYFTNESSEEKTKQNDVLYSTSTEEYIDQLECKLEDVLSYIEGAGKVNVAITVSSGFVYEYAYEEVSKDSLSSNSKSSNLILVNNEPVVVSVNYPTISGILVVAEGGDDIKVKLGILESVQTLLEVTNENITILGGEF